MFHILKINATFEPSRISKRVQFHGDEMQRARDGQLQIVPKIVELAICQHQINRQGPGRVRSEAKADEICAAMKNGIAVSRKEGEPAFRIRFAHEQIDIESSTRVGKQVDGIAAYKKRLESFGTRTRGQSDAVGVGHKTELRLVSEQVEKNLIRASTQRST